MKIVDGKLVPTNTINFVDEEWARFQKWLEECEEEDRKNPPTIPRYQSPDLLAEIVDYDNPRFQNFLRFSYGDDLELDELINRFEQDNKDSYYCYI